MPMATKIFALKLRCHCIDGYLRWGYSNNELVKILGISKPTIIKRLRELEKYGVVMEKRFNPKFFVEGKNNLSIENSSKLRKYIDECCELENEMKAVVVDYNGYPSYEIDKIVEFYNNQKYLRDNANKLFEKIFDQPEAAKEPDYESWLKVCNGFNKGLVYGSEIC